MGLGMSGTSVLTDPLGLLHLSGPFTERRQDGILVQLM